MQHHVFRILGVVAATIFLAFCLDMLDVGDWNVLYYVHFNHSKFAQVAVSYLLVLYAYTRFMPSYDTDKPLKDKKAKQKKLIVNLLYIATELYALTTYFILI